jgi:hypothetical protein
MGVKALLLLPLFLFPLSICCQQRASGFTPAILRCQDMKKHFKMEMKYKMKGHEENTLRS